MYVYDNREEERERESHKHFTRSPAIGSSFAFSILIQTQPFSSHSPNHQAAAACDLVYSIRSYPALPQNLYLNFACTDKLLYSDISLSLSLSLSLAHSIFVLFFVFTQHTFVSNVLLCSCAVIEAHKKFPFHCNNCIAILIFNELVFKIKFTVKIK